MFLLQLESYQVGPDQSRIHDDMMLAIKETSRPQQGHQPINLNSFGKVNKAFCRFVIDFLAVQLVFNNDCSFTAQVAPSPYANDYNNEEVMTRVRHNQRLLIWLVQEMEPTIAQQLLLDRGQPHWESPNLKTVFSQAQAYVTKWRKGTYPDRSPYMVRVCVLADPLPGRTNPHPSHALHRSNLHHLCRHVDNIRIRTLQLVYTG